MKRRNSICGYSNIITCGGSTVSSELLPVRVTAREVEKIDATEDNEEATEEGDGVDRVGSIETLEEDEGGTECSSCEGYVVEWCYSVLYRNISSILYFEEAQGAYRELENCVKALLK